MSIIFCEKHSLPWDSDTNDSCPQCLTEPAMCWRCELPLDEERICSGSGYTLLCAEARKP